MSSLQTHSSLGFISLEEDIIWAMKQRHESMKRIKSDIIFPNLKHLGGSSISRFQKETLIQTMATMVPDQVILNINNHSPEEFTGCLLSGKILGIMELLEFLEKNGKTAYEMNKTLNRYLAAIIEEAMSFEGDILNLSADSFLVLFKSKSLLLLKYYVHSAINCALVIQKKFGKFAVEEGIILQVKLVITAGSIAFCLLGHTDTTCYVCLGPPVDEIKPTEQKSIPGDITVAPSAWTHVNPSEYSSIATEDLECHKILGVGLQWKCAGREHLRRKTSIPEAQEFSRAGFSDENVNKDSELILLHREEDFSLRPRLLEVKDMKDDLAKFLIPPVLITLYSQEPLESLTETRQMVVMHINIKMEKVDVENSELMSQYYKVICNKACEHNGVVTSCMVTNGNVTFTVVFGLRGFTSVIESQEALKCAARCRHDINLFDEVQSVSVSCTTGKSYCGILGHPLRKEYMMIGRYMFKSFCMVHAYPGKVMCDRPTFIYSNLEAHNFILLEFEQVEGLSDKGPIYEYKEKSDRVFPRKDTESLPILGRDEEIAAFLKLFEVYRQNFDTKPCCNFAKCSFKNCMIIEGTYKQGKSRFLQELSTRAEDTEVQKISFRENDYMCSYNAVRLIMNSNLGLGNFSFEYTRREKLMKVLGKSINTDLLYILNDVFDVNFQMEEENTINNEVKWKLIKENVKKLCRKCFKKPTLILLDHAEYMDDESSTLLLPMLETKRFFLIVSFDKTRNGSTNLERLFESHHCERLALKKIPKIYLAGLACQFLGVYAIPSDLEKVIQSKSKGNPGWIQNFLLILQQTKKIKVSEVDFKSIHEQFLIAPPLYMLKKMHPNSIDYYKTLLEERTKDHSRVADPWSVYIDSCRDEFKNVTVRSGLQEIFCKETRVPVCLLNGPLDPETDVDPDVTDDLNFLEMYDRLSYDEQLLLRCAAVLGDPFTRRLLFFIWMPVSQRDAAEVLEKLFEKNVVCCAGGDFSSGGDYILLRDRSYNPIADRSVDCHCVGLDIHDTCLFMAKYASCGFMRFRSEDFCKTVYDLIPNEDRKELHSRAAKFIQKETRRCVSCGCGYFPARVGCKMDNNPSGRAPPDIDKKKKAPQLEQMDFEELFDYSTHLSGRTTLTRSFERGGSRGTLTSTVRITKSFTMSNDSDERFLDLTYEDRHAKVSKFISPLALFKLRRHGSLVRTFSKSDFLTCDCHLILNHMYKRLKYHYTGSEQWHEMIITCIYYVRISLANQNYASCMNTIKEALDILESKSHLLKDPKWKIKMLIAKFYGLKGNVLFDMDETEEALKTFLKAMKTFGLPFPQNERSLRFNLKLYLQKWKHKFRLFFSPSSYLRDETDLTQLYISNSIAEILTNLCKIFMARGEWRFAELAALLSLKHSLQTETNLIRICESFSYMMNIAQHYKRKLFWITLEVHALRYCHKKRNFVEAPELKAVSKLYLTIFEARMARAEFESALQVGYIAVSISTKCSEMTTTIKLFTLVSMILFDKLIINDTTTILRELEYFADEIENNSGRTWYYALAVVFHLETGYILCPFSSVESYFNTEDFARSGKYYEAKIRLILTMWVWYLRNNRWENASMLKNEVQMYHEYKIDSNNHAISHMYLLEGTLLTLVNRINKRSISGMIEMKRGVRRLLKKLHEAAASRPFIKARLYLLEAYYFYILENEDKTKKFLNKSKKFCLKYENKLVLLHLEHSEKNLTGNFVHDNSDDAVLFRHFQNSSDFDMDFDEAVSFLARKLPESPSLFIIYTSALGNFPDILESPIKIPCDEIPHFPSKKDGLVPLHLIYGKISDFYILVQQGRYHRHEGYTPEEISFPVKVASCLGCDRMLAFNAAGTLSDRFELGDLMPVESHVVIGKVDDSSRNIFRRGQKEMEESSSLYDRNFMELAKRVAVEEGMDKYVKSGLYAMIENEIPKNYADIINWRTLGVDAVGTSLIPEVQTASKLGMKIFAMSILTDKGILDYDEYPDPLLEDIYRAVDPKKPFIKKFILKFVDYARNVEECFWQQ